MLITYRNSNALLTQISPLTARSTLSTPSSFLQQVYKFANFTKILLNYYCATLAAQQVTKALKPIKLLKPP